MVHDCLQRAYLLHLYTMHAVLEMLVVLAMRAMLQMRKRAGRCQCAAWARLHVVHINS